MSTYVSFPSPRDVLSSRDGTGERQSETDEESAHEPV